MLVMRAGPFAALPDAGFDAIGACYKNEPAVGMAAEARLRACRLPTLSRLDLPFAWSDPKANAAHVVAADLAARQGFTLPASMLIIAAFPIFAAAAVGLWRLGGRPWLAFGLAVAAGAATFGAFFADDHPVRLLLVDYLITSAAADAAYPYIDAATWSGVQALLDRSTAATLGAMAMLVILAAHIAIRRPAAETTPERILARARWLRGITIAASLFLALAVAAAYGLLHWSSALMTPDAAKATTKLASSALIYWGALWSLGIAVIVAGAMTALKLDMAAADGGATAFADSGLDLDLKRLASLTLAVAAPALTGPALDLLKGLGGL